MRPNTPSLITLTWLDRKRVWATANRDTALGTTRIPVYPSLISGQSSRPSITHRYFTPSYTWLLYTLATVLALMLALVIAAFALLSGCTKGLAVLVRQLDRFLHTPMCPQPALPSSLASRSAELTAYDAAPSIDLANALFCVLGGLDATSGFTPAAPQGLKLLTPSTWDIVTLPRLQGQALALGGALAQAQAPLFRTYLGEWRRLADQASSLATAPAVATSAGTATTVRRRQNLWALSTSSTPHFNAQEGLYAAECARPKNYSCYLTNPWVF